MVKCLPRTTAAKMVEKVILINDEIAAVELMKKEVVKQHKYQFDE